MLSVTDKLGTAQLPRAFPGGLLRRLRTSDLAAFQAYRSIPELGRFQDWLPMSDVEATAFLAGMSEAPLCPRGGWVQLGIAEADADQLMGDIGILVSADGLTGEIGFTLAPDAQGRGIATAAVRQILQFLFEVTGVNRVLGITDSRNVRSVRLLERVGQKHGITPAGVITHERGAKDFSSPVLKLKSLEPDYVINRGAVPAYGALVFKEAQKLAWKPKWVGMAGIPFREPIKLAGSSMDYAGDVYAVAVVVQAEGDSPGSVEFREAIKKYHPKVDVDYAGIVGYGFGKSIVEGLKRAEANNDLTREGVIKALETLKDFQTEIFPPITYTSASHAGPDSCMLVKRAGDSWVPVTGEWLKAK